MGENAELPEITITDELGVEVAATGVLPKAGSLSKYCHDPKLTVVLLKGLESILSQPLQSTEQKSLDLGLKFAHKVNLGTGEPTLLISADTTQTVTLAASPAKALGADDSFGPPDASAGSSDRWVSVELKSTVTPGVSIKSGDLCFGVTPGCGLSSTYVRRFATTHDQPTVGEALSETLAHFVLPVSLSDVEQMATGDFSAITGTGSLKLTGDVTITASANPLASPKLPLIDEAFQVQAGGTFDIGGTVVLSGEFQLRVERLAGASVLLGWYRRQGMQWTVSAKGSAGVGLNVGKTDLLEKLIEAISGSKQEDLSRLKAGGLGDDEIKTIQDQIEKSVEHSLKASVDVELAMSPSDEAAFQYRVDISALDSVALAAVESALQGDLTPITSLERRDGGHGVIAPGITVMRSVLKTVRDRKPSLKVNLIGLLNFSSMFDLLRKSQVLYEPVTGDLTVNETVSGTNIDALTLPMAQEKLRKLHFESLLATSAYRASRSVSSLGVTSTGVYFAFNDNTNEHTMSDYLDAFVAVGLMDDAAKRQAMEGFPGTGASTCQIRVTFDDAACDALFLRDGAARAQTEYEEIGRRVWSRLLQAPPHDVLDADRPRREVLASDSIWAQLKTKGQPSFGDVLPGLAHDPERLERVRTDFTIIMWWAMSMASTAAKLAAMRKFMGSADPSSLRGDPRFAELREDLQKHLADAISHSSMKFGLPYGLAALFQAAAPAGAASGSVISDRFTRRFGASAAA